LVALLSSCACRHKNSAAFVQSHTCGCYSFDCPASPEKEDQRAAGRPAALTQLALCLRLASNLRPKADNAPSTLNDSTRQWRLCEVQVWRIQPLYCVRVIIVRLNMRSKPRSFVQN
jgi:hypothetical protein